MKITSNIIRNSVGVAVLFLLPFMASAAVLNSTLSVSSTAPAVGSNVAVSGSCGTPGANNSVNFALSRNGSTLALSPSASTDASGYFSTSLGIPSNYGSGPAIFVATCNGSGDTIDSPGLSIQSPPPTTISNPGEATIGSTITVSGQCPSTLSGSNVSFSIINGGNSFTLPAVSTTIGSSGAYDAGVGLSGNLTPGSATIFATCPDGSVASATFTLDPALAIIPAPPVTTPTPTPLVPVGGVAAGSGPIRTEIEFAVAALLLLAGLAIARKLILSRGQ